MGTRLNFLLGAAAFPVALVFAEVAVAQMVTVKERAYWGIVTQYAHGDRGIALAGIGVWTEKDLDAVGDSVEGLAKAASKCGACEARQRFDALPLRAAILLHAQRDRNDRIQTIKQADGAADCSTSAQGLSSERLLGFVALQPRGQEFVARFSVAMSMDSRAMLCFLRAGQWAETGLKAAPRDARLFVALGLAAETIGTTGYTEPVPFATLDSRGRQSFMAMRSGPVNKTHQMNAAREAFEKALAIEPGQDEARLRLGRVLWRLGRAREAQESLGKAVNATEGATRYLAHLFLGQCLEDGQNLGGAIDEYKAALSLRPDTQIGAVALAHALSLRGDVDRAREILEPVLAFSGQRKSVDPYWIYLIGVPELTEPLLEALHLESVR